MNDLNSIVNESTFENLWQILLFLKIAKMAFDNDYWLILSIKLIIKKKITIYPH